MNKKNFPGKTIKKLTIIIFFISLLLYGCSAETILIKTSSQDYQIDDSLKRSDIFISKVIDNREVNKNQIVEINNKNINKIFELDEPVADYILKYFNPEKEHIGAVKINLFIDQLFPIINIEDDSSFYLYNFFRFLIVNKDSTFFIKTNQKRLTKYWDEKLILDFNSLLDNNLIEFYNSFNSQKENSIKPGSIS